MYPEVYMPFSIVRNDITLMSVDAIVNSANPNAVIGGGVDWAIHKAAGASLLEARKKIGPIATGSARITPGYNLKAKYVIHTVGPVWQGGDKSEEQLLALAYTNSLKLAVENGCESVAFPLISSGIFGYPKAGGYKRHQQISCKSRNYGLPCGVGQKFLCGF